MSYFLRWPLAKHTPGGHDHDQQNHAGADKAVAKPAAKPGLSPHTDLYPAIAAKLKDKFWASRAAEMIRAVTIPNRAVELIETRVLDLKVPAQWPMKGSITFTRAPDGQKFKAYLQKKRGGKTGNFKVDPV